MRRTVDVLGASQFAAVAATLESLGGGMPKIAPTRRAAAQFIFPNGLILRFDLAPGQYSSRFGPHINLELPGGGNIHIRLR